MRILIFFAVVGIATAQLAHHRVQVQLTDANQQRPVQVQGPTIEIIRTPNLDETPRDWQQPQPNFPIWDWQHDPFPAPEHPGPRLPPWAERLPQPEQPQQPIWDNQNWNMNVPIQRPGPEPIQQWPNQWQQPEQIPQWLQPEQPQQWPQFPQPDPNPQWPNHWPQFPQPDPNPQWPGNWPQPEPEPLPPQRPTWPNQRPELPNQRPQLPNQRPNRPIHPPNRQPIPPAAHWNQGRPDPRCPVPDNHEGFAIFLPGDAQWDFFICWGGWAWPFQCPEGTVFRPEVNVCADPAWTPPLRIRPFNDEEATPYESEESK